MAARYCDMCHQTDDHPRHVIVTESQVFAYHLDCHAPTCVSCAGQISDVLGVTGDSLRAHLMRRGQ